MLLAIFAGYNANGSTVPITDVSGFTRLSVTNKLTVFSSQQSDYKLVSSAQSSITVAYGSTYQDFYFIVDALVAGPTPLMGSQRVCLM